MPTWEARITREAPPSQQVEHGLRYQLVSELVRDAALWVDLGSGTGAAQHAVAAPGRVLLVDNDAAALTQASREIVPGDVETLEADLGTAEGCAAVREKASGADLVTCFELLPQLEDFTHVVELLLALGSGGATVAVSVPNDAFWAIDNPLRKSSWGEGAAEELRRLLPADATTLRQVPIVGSAIGDGPARLGDVDVPAERTASHFIVVFGARAGELAPVAAARAADLDADRRRQRQAESDLAVLEARLAADGG